MRPKRPFHLVALALLPVLAALTWLAGYLYWLSRMGRAIEDLKRAPDRYPTQLF